MTDRNSELSQISKNTSSQKSDSTKEHCQISWCGVFFCLFLFFFLQQINFKQVRGMCAFLPASSPAASAPGQAAKHGYGFLLLAIATSSMANQARGGISATSKLHNGAEGRVLTQHAHYRCYQHGVRPGASLSIGDSPYDTAKT